MFCDIKFITIFCLLALPLLLLLGINGLIGILSISSLCAIAAELLTRRATQGASRQNRKWLSILRCAGISAAILGLAFTARIHMAVMAIAITGSPSDAPVINTPKVLLISWCAAFVSITVILAVFRRKEGVLHHGA